MRDIALSADERLIEAARARARAEHTTLNGEFRRWLAEYRGRKQKAETAMSVVGLMRKCVRTRGRGFSRAETDER